VADLNSVKPGDPFGVDADTWNLLLQMASDYRLQNGHGLTQKPSQRRPAVATATDVVLCQNTTTDNLLANSAVYVSSAVVEPTDNAPEFQRRVVMTAATPTSAAAGRWGVLLTALTPGQLGNVVMIGAVQCWVNIISTSDTAVEVVSGSYVPQSGASGSATLLYVAGGVGSATTTGEQWVTIRIGGGGDNGPRFVHLVNDGGSDGHATGTPAYATWTYTAHDVVSGAVIARKLPLVTARLLATATTTANWGSIYPAASSAYSLGAAGFPPLASGESSSSEEPESPWRLVWCDETYGQEADCVIGGD
jgi:hypothetical protein